MKWRPSPELGGKLANGFIALLGRTWRVEVRGKKHWEQLVRDRRPFAFLLWHEMLLPLLWHHRGQGIAVVVSEARDGQYLAEVAERLGYQNLFGSSTRGGTRALLQAIRLLGSGIPVAFTPDGPRGPRRAVKPGVVKAAQRADAVILPIVAVPDRAWRLSSWDRFVIPKPWARVRIGYGTPYSIPAGETGLEQGVADAAKALDDLERELEWENVATRTD